MAAGCFYPAWQFSYFSSLALTSLPISWYSSICGFSDAIKTASAENMLL
jgi:hypothetical protein